MNIEKLHLINSDKLSSEFYFSSLLEEAYLCGLLDKSDIEDIQLQCINLLSYKSEKYNMGDSSSIKIETAESIMLSNLYTIGIYLKTLPDPDYAAKELKTVNIAELYERGRKLVYTGFQEAKCIYKMVLRNKIDTPNHSYNSTISENGLGIFFKSYNIDFGAHDSAVSIDYQLCNPVNGLTGIEFIQKYLEKLHLENEFCLNFSADDIHHLLYGFDKEYKDLLINIFEHVLTAVLGCSLANRSISELYITEEDIRYLYEKLLEVDNHTLMLSLLKSAENIFDELSIKDPSLQKYIKESLSKIAADIENALKTDTLDKVFITSVNPDLEPRIRFESGAKMDDESYRRLIDELLSCRLSSDRLALIKEKVKAFDDLEDILLDAQLEEEEFISLFDALGDVEIAAMVKRHPLETDIRTFDLSEEEQAVRSFLKKYIEQIPTGRQERILQITDHILGD